MKLVKETKAQAKNDIQLTALTVFTVAPIVQLIDLGQNINRYLDTATNIMLAILMSAAAITGLIGSLTSEIKPGFIAELGGWLGIIMVFGVYLGVAVATNSQWFSAISTWFFIIFILGSASRAVKILKALRRLSLITRHKIKAL